ATDESGAGVPPADGEAAGSTWHGRPARGRREAGGGGAAGAGGGGGAGPPRASRRPRAGSPCHVDPAASPSAGGTPAPLSSVA
ncbi:MAG: hypothetical protein LBK99_07780, partial [Opitutaceae bacterium]|nr:hypothetical protein [Opitutaceae bacterium]